MTTANFIPEVWSARLLVSFRKNYVYRGLCNTDYEGEIRNAGDTVHINTPGPITTGAYSGTVSYQTLQSTQQDLLIDQQQYFAFTVPNVDAVQANVRLVDVYSAEAGESMADVVDQNIAALYTAAGHTVALDVSSDSTGVWDAFTEASQKLDESNVPSSNRWMVVSPLVYRKMKQYSNFIHASDLGDNVLRSGELGMIDNFHIFMSNNIPVATQHKCVFGHKAAIAFAEQVVLMQAGQHENTFGDYVRGLMVFGRKVIRPTAFGLLNVTVA